MRKELLSDIVGLTRECIEKFWQKDPEFTLSHFDKDIFYIGSVSSDYFSGIAAVANYFLEMMEEIPPCHIMREEFNVVQHMGKAAAVAGRYITTTDDFAEYPLAAEQRCTFVWQLTDNVPKVMHCHISNPMGELALADGEKFPTALGEMNKKYIESQINFIRDERRIVVKDRDEAIHFLLPSEIVCARANKRNSVIYTLNGGEIDALMNITDFLSAAGQGFTAPHRSYVINTAFMKRIRKYEIIMCDGRSVPINEKKYKKTRETLKTLYNLSEG